MLFGFRDERAGTSQRAVYARLKSQGDRQGAFAGLRCGNPGPGGCGGAGGQGGFGAREVVVRINGLDSDWGKPDIAAFANAPPDAVLLPKVNCGNDIRAVHPLLPSNVAIWAMIETTRAMLRLEDIASAGAGLRCFVMGTNDLAKELRAPLTQARANLHGLLTLSVTAARAFGLAILDGVFNDIDDELGFAAQCAQAVEFGFDGKTLIHPRQIGPCNLAFSPDHSAIAWAQRIVAAFELPGNACRGAIRVDGKMVELLHLEAARDTLARAAVSGT